MAGKVFSCSFHGLKCRIIEVQADISRGMPAFNIVGLGDTSVHESRERVRSSIKNSGAEFPVTRKIINLAPAQVKKQGSLFDLPIAISILLADNQITDQKIQNSIIIGELSLNGFVKPVNGILAITHHAKQKGITNIFLPEENALEASFIEGINIYPIKTLAEFIKFCKSEQEINIYPNSKEFNAIRRNHKGLKINSIVGLQKAKRGLQIAAAGGHNTLLYGSPGCGKTVLCRAFQSLLSKMNRKEIIETTKLYSIAGLLDSQKPLISKRPFREVHHTASIASIIGGGSYPKPGEISLAHNGVLFFDEIAEFPKSALEALRQPLEDKIININRIHFSLKFPCNFIFLATMNPCPCGYLYDKKIKCICTDHQIRNYQKKLSGPLIDRFDIFLEISKIPMNKIYQKNSPKEDSPEKLVQNAKNIQKIRFKNKKITQNSDMQLNDLLTFCPLNKEEKTLLNQAAETLNFSSRAYLKTIKIARTIADLENSIQIKENHITEAIQYRNPKP